MNIETPQLDPEPTPPRSPFFPRVQSDRIAQDLPCDSCAYQLQGLPYTGVCPECGWSIVQTLRASVLAYSSPLYLRTLRTGAQLLGFGGGIVGLIWSGFALYSLAYIAAGEDLFDSGAALGLLILWLVATAAAIGALALGWRTLAAPDAEVRPASLNAAYRRPTRWLATAIGLLTASAYGSGILATGMDRYDTGEALLLIMIPSILGLVVLIPVCWFFSISYFRTLSRRLGDPALDVRARRLRVRSFISLICVVVGLVLLAVLVESMEWARGAAVVVPLAFAGTFVVMALDAFRYRGLAAAFVASLDAQSRI